MSRKKIIGYAFLNAVIAAAYIFFVAFLMNNFEAVLGPGPEALAASAFLLLFVISAAIMGVVVFGRSVVWFLNGQKHEAVHLILYTIFFLLIITLFVFLGLVFSS